MSTSSEQVRATEGAGTEETPRDFFVQAEGGDWDAITREAIEHSDERIVVNMGPQHPSTHGVLRLILELDGETVTEARVGIGYLHTGIEKTMEHRTFTQGVTLCTRMDYLTPMFQETAYCLAVERLLGIEDQIPERATLIRVLMMECTRISSHLVCLGTGGMELGATTVMTIGFRERERLFRLIEATTGLRMNNGYIRPGGVSNDLPSNWKAIIDQEWPLLRQGVTELEALCLENPILRGRMCDVGYLDLTGCMALGVTGPILKAAGMPYDLRKAAPYCGYETYDFEVPTWDSADAYGRLRVRFREIWESLKIIDQVVERLQACEGEPVMVADKKIAWPAQLAVGPDGQGNSLEHIKEIMGTSMESLIHHFKLVTEGFRVPAGQAYIAVESPKGELGCHLVSDGGTRPYRAHFRDPAFNNLQAVAAMVEGGAVADTVVAVASIDPVLGGVDR
ncbi:NADH-quinone oxidoreductase subunit D [Austwickia sp. TVS 96-490-7B]|uniref:NADH-quinone oxidoreductase subunit D n=1 Tax=Austwickia sp. TVS 96-490-7B TaxID=2830843 RepID=UPI001C57B3A9|nr:NADH-quinone oxidoreductase subunit D [Austwickia sp. TVS 96-490-7B]MBW3085667.1 NADH-quinone oxidoreductase subunit D [Austwickia sp. TVS 96-490-7B]